MSNIMWPRIGIPEDYITTIELAELEKSFNLEDLYEKFLNACKNGDLQWLKDNWPTEDQQIESSAYITNNSDFLHTAFENEHFEILEFLLDKVADLEGMNKEQQNLAHIAVEKRNRRVVELLLSKYRTKFDINTQTGRGETLLYLACRSGDQSIIQLLLKHHPDLNLQNLEGDTPLHIVCKSNKIELVKILLNQGADSNIKNKEGKSPVSISIEDQNTAILFTFVTHDATYKRLLVEREKKSERINKLASASIQKLNEEIQEKQDRFNNQCIYACKTGDLTWLIHRWIHQQKRDVDVLIQPDREFALEACVNGQVGVLEFLFSIGISPGVTNSANVNLLHIAIEARQAEVVKFLVPKYLNQIDINGKANKGYSPLFQACSWGNIEIVELLLQNKADPNNEDDRGGTPLHQAASGNYPEVIELLVKYHANLNGGTHSSIISPLALACKEKKLQAVAMLLKCGANCNARSEGLEPLLISLREKDIDTLRLLIQFGANYREILFQSIEQKKIATVKMLIEAGIDVNIPDKFSQTPLHYFAREQNIDMVKLLLDKYAQVNHPDQFGQTPLFIAVALDHLEIAKLLVEKGALPISSKVEGILKVAGSRVRPYLLKKFKDLE